MSSEAFDDIIFLFFGDCRFEPGGILKAEGLGDGWTNARAIPTLRPQRRCASGLEAATQAVFGPPVRRSGSEQQRQT
jgi:hypothetical protein